MNVPLIVGISIGSIVVLGGGIFAWLYFFKRKKYGFIVYSKNNIRADVIYGTVVRDSKNKSIKKFKFPDNDSKLDVLPPTLFIGKEGFREVTFNDLGELSYLKGHDISTDLYKKKAMTPEEKTILAMRVKENERRYQNPLDKVNAGVILSGFILILILTVGVIYSTVKYSQLTGDWIEITKEQKAIAKIHESTAARQVEATQHLTQVVASISQNMNITRRLS